MKLPKAPFPWIMGIVNATPDSFYSGGRSPDWREAVERGLRMAEEGADFLDVGGESTRPGAEAVSAEEECRRVLPVIEALARRARVPVSVDTSKAEVARRALGAGAEILNDVAALRGDPAMPRVAAKFPRVILMHMQGTPRTMQANPRYDDVVGELLSFFCERLEAFEDAGGDSEKTWIDPGIGFGKNLNHNVQILRRLEEFRALGRPMVLGVSRKSFLGTLSAGDGAPPLPPEDRLEGSLAVACRALETGVEALRVHDVGATRRALRVFSAVRGGVPASAKLS